MENLPRYWGKQDYGRAALTAELRDFTRPRYTEPDPEPATPPRLITPWQPEEALVPFAVTPVPTVGMPPAAARALKAHRADLPAWAAEAVDWAAVESALRTEAAHG